MLKRGAPDGSSGGKLRLRARDANSFQLTLVVPGLGFYGLLQSQGTSRWEAVTVRSGHWTQLEIQQASSLHSREIRTVLRTASLGSNGVETVWSRFIGGRKQRTTFTRIGNGGDASWRSSDAAGNSLGSGRIMDGAGSGVDAAGQHYTQTTVGNRTTTVTQLHDGGQRAAVTTDTSFGSTTTWVTKDPSGAPVGSGVYTEDHNTGAWSKSSTTPDGSGGAITTNSSGTVGSTTTEKVHTDASGNVVESERSVETKGEGGTSSKATSSVDVATGEVTIETVSKGSDGTVYTHVTVSDAAGNVIRDETTETPAGGQPADGGTPSGGNAPAGGGGTGDPPSAGNPPAGGGDPPSGGGDPPSGGGGSSSDVPDDDETNPRRGVHPGAGGEDGPHFPGGPLGPVFNDLVVNPSGDEHEPDEHGGLSAIIGRRLRQVVIAASDATSSASGDGSLGDDSGFIVDIVVPAPPGAVDDWGDRPDPRAMGAIGAQLASQAAALFAASAAMQQV